MYTIGTLAKTHRLYPMTVKALLEKNGISPVQVVDTGARTVALYGDSALAAVKAKAEALKAKRLARSQREAEAKPIDGKALAKRLKRIDNLLEVLLAKVNNLQDMIGREQ
jgi:hypothetical protein